MAYEETLAARVRDLLADDPITERRMFGGLAFLLRGNMAVTVSGNGLMLRCDPDLTAELIADGADPVVMRGRELRGWVRLPEIGADDADVDDWVERGAAYARTLPPKPGQ